MKLHMSRQIIYFPGLNGLRFLSALAVIITHVELMQDKLGLENSWSNLLIHNLGVIGVSFFFVLSGFLITYLMIEERDRFKSFSVKSFYLRRIFRIWPLYFLILILGFFILPNFTYVPFFSENLEINFLSNLIIYLFIFPNIALSIFPAVPLIGQSWSIGVEEQFYLIWPIIFKFFKNFNLILLIKLLFLFVFMKFVVLLFSLQIDSNWLLVVKKNLAMLKFENMIIGAMGAVIMKNKDRYIKYVLNNMALFFSVTGIFLSLYIIPNYLRDGLHILHALFFIIVILNVSSNPSSFLKLENKLLNFLGRISYGIYMYHLIVIYFTIKLLEIYDTNSKLLLYTLSILLTCIVSYISYIIFEKRFLNLKDKFAILKATN